MSDQVLFYVFATIAVVTSALVIGQSNPMYSVLLLIVSFAALAGLYIGLDAPFVAKVAGILFFYIWMRWTVPRYRYDQLMKFGWKWLLPASVINLLVTAAAMLYFNA